MAKKQVRKWWIGLSSKGVRVRMLWMGDTSWSTVGPEEDHLKCMHLTKGMPTGQYDGESSHAFFEDLSEALVHSCMQRGEQGGGIGGLHAVAGLRSHWGHRDVVG